MEKKTPTFLNHVTNFENLIQILCTETRRKKARTQYFNVALNALTRMIKHIFSQWCLNSVSVQSQVLILISKLSVAWIMGPLVRVPEPKWICNNWVLLAPYCWWCRRQKRVCSRPVPVFSIHSQHVLDFSGPESMIGQFGAHLFNL